MIASKQQLGILVQTLSILALSGCGPTDPQAGDVVRRPGEPPISLVADDDKRMSSAIDTARKTVDTFIAALKKPKANQNSFAAKLPVRDGEMVEHMWLTPVRFDGTHFIGKIGNEPDRVTTVKYGQEKRVAKGEISDWMFVEDDVLVGGYTIRAIRDGMSKEEQEEFDESVPFQVK